MTPDVELRAIGTTARVSLSDPRATAAARSILVRRLDTLDRAASWFRDDSELMLLERSPRRPRRVSRELFGCVRVALWAARVTDGAVDPTLRAGTWMSVRLDEQAHTLYVPPGVRLDFGATGKALAADRIARDIHSGTGSGVVVSLGGDVAVAGGASWPIGIADDHAAAADDVAQVVRIASGGLATSSTAVRGRHIIDPRTGEPADSPWRTISVAASSCVAANAASTAAIVKGEGGPAWLEDQTMPARLVAHDGSIVRTAGWPA